MRWTTTFCMILALLLFQQAFSQTTAQEQIDREVWQPFERTYGSLDAEAFLAVHANDAIRVGRDSKNINSGEAYRQEILKTVASYRQRGGQRSIELRFTERFAKDDLAFDSGYYKVVVRYSADEAYTFYGQFDVILRKIDGRWKIQVDADSSHGGTVTEQDFLQGKRVGEY